MESQADVLEPAGNRLVAYRSALTGHPLGNINGSQLGEDDIFLIRVASSSSSQ